MALYSVTELNQIVAGNNRIFLNMDIQISDYVQNSSRYILKKEKPLYLSDEMDNVISSNLQMEHLRSTIERTISGDAVIACGKPDKTDGYQTSAMIRTNTRRYISKDGSCEYEDVMGLSVTESDRYVPISENGGERDFIGLSRKESYYETNERIKKYNQSLNIHGQIYSIDVNELNQHKNELNGIIGKILPMYEIQDVSLKSDNRVGNSNFHNFDFNKTEDIYVPQMDSNPIGICQNGNTSYIMTGNTEKDVDMMKVTLGDDRNRRYSTEYYNGYLDCVDNRAVLYKHHDKILENTKNPDFGQFVQMNGIENGYIFAVNQSENNGLQSDYDDGNIYGQIYQTKSQYNSTYDMQLSSYGKMSNCRKYVGIGTQNGKIYLKYHDMVDYANAIESEIENDTECEKMHVCDVAKSENNTYPYQKIEFFQPNGLTNVRNHKSNFFSVKIKNTVFSDQNSDTEIDSDELKVIKKNIMNAVRDIAENTCPVNTQLFDVQFKDF